MDFMHIYYPESRFGDFTDIDGTIAFYIRVQSLVQRSFVVLDFGCGRGSHNEELVTLRRDIRVFQGKVNRVIGLDVDPAAKDNPFLDEFHLLKGDERWPLADNSVNLCVCDCVLEHLENPESFFSEARRVIGEAGYLCIRTPNLWNYISLAAKLIPDSLHAKVLASAQQDRKEVDVFPTLHRCNSIPKVNAMLEKYGFESVVYGYESEPRYLSFSRIAYWFGVMHQKFAPSFFRPVIFAFARIDKPVTS